MIRGPMKPGAKPRPTNGRRATNPPRLMTARDAKPERVTPKLRAPCTGPVTTRDGPTRDGPNRGDANRRPIDLDIRMRGATFAAGENTGRGAVLRNPPPPPRIVATPPPRLPPPRW